MITLWDNGETGKPSDFEALPGVLRGWPLLKQEVEKDGERPEEESSFFATIGAALVLLIGVPIFFLAMGFVLLLVAVFLVPLFGFEASSISDAEGWKAAIGKSTLQISVFFLGLGVVLLVARIASRFFPKAQLVFSCAYLGLAYAAALIFSSLLLDQAPIPIIGAWEEAVASILGSIYVAGFCFAALRSQRNRVVPESNPRS